MTQSYRYPPESKPLDGFTIKRALQRGGFGEVYFAISDAGKEVALKLLQSNFEIELRGVSQCLNLKHPNLLTIFDVRQNVIGEHWVVMEFMAGQTLDEVLGAHPNGLSASQIESLLAGIASGVAYLHEQGLVHRDLKPANIYVENGLVKVGDVGLSKFISTSRRSEQTQSVGTIYYMAPEIAHGRYGHEIDVYSLGVLLFEMLTGKLPFDGESTGEILMKQLTQPPNLSVLPARLRPVLQRALAKDPAQRTPTPTALVNEYRMAIGSPIAASPKRTVPQIDEEPVLAEIVEPVRVFPASQCFLPDVPQRVESGPHWSNLVVSLISGAVVFLVCVWMVRYFGSGPVPIYALVLSMIAVGLVVRAVTVSVRKLYRINSVQYRHEPRESRSQRMNNEYLRHQSPGTRQVGRIDRLAELSGSMSVTAVCSSLVALALWWLNAFLRTPTEALFFAVGTTWGSWAAIIPAKLWEGRSSDGLARRLTTMCLGACVGTALFGLSDYLNFKLNIQCAEHVASSWSSQMNFSLNAAMALQGYVAFFAMLMLSRRWWNHVDAFRDYRLRLSTVFVTTCAAFVISFLTEFPADWAVMWGMTISATAQLAAVWVPTPLRHRA